MRMYKMPNTIPDRNENIANIMEPQSNIRPAFNRDVKMSAPGIPTNGDRDLRTTPLNNVSSMKPYNETRGMNMNIGFEPKNCSQNLNPRK